MAGDGVRLVERLRLGERPAVVDWKLAASLLALRDAGDELLVAANDLVDDKAKASKPRRFEVRVQLLALASARLEAAVSQASADLESYFERRAEDEGDEEYALPVAGHEAPLDSIRNELTAVLETGGIGEADAKALGDTGETIRLDCAWLDESLTKFVGADASVDQSLDFCGDIEARFVLDAYQVGGDTLFSAALLSAFASARGGA